MPGFNNRATEMASAAADGAADGEKMILLISSDGEKFELPEVAASLSKTLGNMIEDDCATDCIPLANVASNILAKVVEYCNKHATSEAAAAKASREEELRKFDTEFVNIDKKMLLDLIMAANFLNVPCLLDLTCQHAADLIKDMMPEQVRVMFGIENDFTPEEEAEVRKENAWAYEI